MQTATAASPFPENPAAEAKALLERAGVVFREPARMLWRISGGQVVGAFAWTGFDGQTVQMHYAGRHKHWMTKEFLRQAFTYPFDQLGVKVILGFLPANRTHAVAVAVKLGFKKLCVVPGVDLHMIAMTRADCRWLQPAKRSNG
jgi:hypothetical protein